jgi:hypothetical protein
VATPFHAAPDCVFGSVCTPVRPMSLCHLLSAQATTRPRVTAPEIKLARESGSSAVASTMPPALFISANGRQRHDRQSPETLTSQISNQFHNAGSYTIVVGGHLFFRGI